MIKIVRQKLYYREQFRSLSIYFLKREENFFKFSRPIYFASPFGCERAKERHVGDAMISTSVIAFYIHFEHPFELNQRQTLFRRYSQMNTITLVANPRYNIPKGINKCRIVIFRCIDESSSVIISFRFNDWYMAWYQILQKPPLFNLRRMLFIRLPKGDPEIAFSNSQHLNNIFIYEFCESSNK